MSRWELLKISFFCLFLCFGLQALSSVEISGNPIGCLSKDAKFQKLRLSGKVRLNKLFLIDSGELNEAHLKEIVELQVKHLMAYYRNTSTDGLNVAVSAFRDDLVIKAPVEVSYGADFRVDAYLPPERSHSNSKYIEAALKRGFVSKDDPAYEVEYSVKLMLADCSANSFLKLSSAELPLDPFLSLWIEDKKDRAPRKFGPKSLQEVSSCAADDFVNFGNSDQAWFFWSPKNEKQSVDGRKLKCTPKAQGSLYNPSWQLLANVPATKPITKSFFSGNSVFRSTAFFGVIDNANSLKREEFPELKKSLVTIFKDCAAIASVPKCSTYWSQLSQAKYKSGVLEFGAYNFIIYLKYLFTMIDIKTFEVSSKSEDEEILVSFSGKFRESKKEIEGEVYYGSTTFNYGPTLTKLYSKVLNRSFKDSDSISYLGHSGLGHNFKMQNLTQLWKRDRLEVPIRKKPLWLGLYNCEGFSYFGFDLESAFAKGSFKLNLTQSSGTEAGARFPLAQLDVVDSIFQNKSVDVGSRVMRFVQTREFLTETRLEVP